MTPHEEFLELCAAATAGELNPAEQANLDAHLTECAECRKAMREFEIASRHGVAALASGLAPEKTETDNSWSVEKAEEAFFKRLDKEAERQTAEGDKEERTPANRGQRFTYRPSLIRWREVWMPFAAAVLLAVALSIAAYRTGIKRGTDVVRTVAQPIKEAENSLEAQVSDAGYERAQLAAKLNEDAKVIDELKRQLSEQIKIVSALKSTQQAPSRPSEDNQQTVQRANAGSVNRDEQFSAAQAKLTELQKTVQEATAQRDENARQAATLEAKVNELTQLVRAREQALDQKEVEVAKGQELLQHDRDIRELMGARELYMADVHDVSGKGTDKTYGRVFYTKGKRLIFYAFDLDAQPGIENASTFQAWGRKGPDKQQARSLGIFYEDNVSKKRWVLKADDPKSLEDIDAVFVTVEPHGGSPHPSGKQLLFAYLRVSPNHP
jgi:Putative zinc-finger